MKVLILTFSLLASSCLAGQFITAPGLRGNEADALYASYSITSEVATAQATADAATYTAGTAEKTAVDAAITAATSNLVERGTNVYTVTVPTPAVRTYDFNDDWLEYRREPLPMIGLFDNGKIGMYDNTAGKSVYMDTPAGSGSGITADSGDATSSPLVVFTVGADGVMYNVPFNSTNINVRFVIGSSPGAYQMRVVGSTYESTASGSVNRISYQVYSTVATGGVYNVSYPLDRSLVNAADTPTFLLKVFDPLTDSFPTNKVFLVSAYAETVTTNEAAKVLATLIDDMKAE